MITTGQAKRKAQIEKRNPEATFQETVDGSKFYATTKTGTRGQITCVAEYGPRGGWLKSTFYSDSGKWEEYA